jgi:L-rhamnonate dehydratase
MNQRLGYGLKVVPQGMVKNVALIRALLKAVGDHIELAADAYMSWDVGYAMPMTERLREYNLFWLAERLVSHELEGNFEL